MENTTIKRVVVQQFKAFCERNQENNWDEYIVIYDELNREVARSGNNHPEGMKSFHWKGFEFIAMGYSGSPRTPCYVKCSDKIFFEQPTE
jgi:hypothetical protein